MDDDKPQLSILEKFRQLSKEKEQERCQTKETNKSVGAVYLSNHSDSSVLAEKQKWNNHRGGREGNRRDGGTFQRKRKFDGEHSSPPDWKIKRAQERNRSGNHVGLKAKDVSITEYISSLPGFTGIIKQRFSDFQVSEIAEDGRIAKLTTQAIPKDPEPCNDVPLENDEDMFKILPKADWDKLYSIVEDEDPVSSVDIEVTDWPKEKRIEVHNAIKHLFKEKVYSNTVEVGDKKILKIMYSKNGGYKAHRRSLWRNKEYLHFVLHKDNMDTTEAINIISHKLLKKSNTIQFSGTKDKRAKTSQFVSVRRVTADRLNKIQPLKGIYVGNYEYKNSSLRMGQLKGNRFRIVIRKVDASDEVLSNAIESLKGRGFINYFGMQRFGASVIVPTHIVGKALIHQDWKQAVELLLKPRPGERCFIEISEARQIWWDTRDAKKALKCFHWKTACLEAKVLQGLDKNGPNAYLNALENMPRNLMMFYCHAYQSLIWNKVVSRRVKEFGLTPLAGDIVLCKDSDAINTDKVSESINDKNDKEENEEEDKEEDDTTDTKNPIDEFIAVASRYKSVKFLTEEEAKQTSIENVVYPLPGFDIQYPKNVIADWYNEYLKEDNITQETLMEIKRFSHLFSMYGAFRKIIEKPDNVTWSLKRYSEENSDLIISDIEEMNGLKPVEDVPDGKYKALILEFDLPPCSYATMALHEIMKCDTSSSYQAFLSAQHLAEVNATNDNNSETCKSNGEKSILINSEEPVSGKNCLLTDAEMNQEELEKPDMT